MRNVSAPPVLRSFVVGASLLAVWGLLRGWELAAEREFQLGPVSVPVLTAIFVVAIGAELLLGDRGVRGDSLSALKLIGFLIGAYGVLVAVIVGGTRAGMIYYLSFIVWHFARAKLNHLREIDVRLFVWWSSVLSLVSLVATHGIRVMPDNINLVAMLLATSAAFVLELRVRTGAAVSRIHWILPVVALVLDGRRTAVLSVLLVLAVVVQRANAKQAAVRLGLLVVGALFVAIAATVADGSDTAVGRFLSTFDIFSEERSDLDNRRTQLTEIAVELVASDPVGGVGAGRYLEEAALRSDAGLKVARPHNMILFMWAELGVIGLSGALAILSIPLWVYRRAGVLTLVPATIFMLTNDYYFSPGYFLALMLGGYVNRAVKPSPGRLGDGVNLKHPKEVGLW